MKTLAVINAIILAGDRVASVVSGAGSMPDIKNLTKIIDELKGLMNPDLVESSEAKLKKDKERLFREVDRGPIAIREDGSRKIERKRRML